MSDRSSNGCNGSNDRPTDRSGASATPGANASHSPHGTLTVLQGAALYVGAVLGTGVIALPALTIIADGLITIGGWIGSSFFLRYNTLFYLEQLRSAFAVRDLVLGLLKAFLFGFVIAFVAADEGLNVGRGVGLIGDATTRAIVFCLLGVLAADSFVNAVFYFIPGLGL